MQRLVEMTRCESSSTLTVHPKGGANNQLIEVFGPQFGFDARQMGLNSLDAKAQLLGYLTCRTRTTHKAENLQFTKRSGNNRQNQNFQMVLLKNGIKVSGVNCDFSCFWTF